MNFTDFELLQKSTIDAHRYHMDTRGYSVIRNFYDEGICAYLEKALEKAVNEYVPVGTDRSIKDKYLLHDLMSRDIVFCRTLEDPRLQQLVSAILDDFWIMYAYTSSSLPPGGKNYGSRIHVDSPRFITNYPTNVGLIWLLNDFTEENGATKVLPGSHHSSITPSEDLFNSSAVQLTGKKGDLVIFNARVFHQAGENRSNKWRHSLTMNVCRPYMKQRCDWVRFIPQEFSNQLNDQARRIIGFDTRLPTSLAEFFVEDKDRLYKPNQE